MVNGGSQQGVIWFQGVLPDQEMESVECYLVNGGSQWSVAWPIERQSVKCCLVNEGCQQGVTWFSGVLPDQERESLECCLDNGGSQWSAIWSMEGVDGVLPGQWRESVECYLVNGGSQQSVTWLMEGVSGVLPGQWRELVGCYLVNGGSRWRCYLVNEGSQWSVGNVVLLTSVSPRPHVFVIDVLHHSRHVHLHHNINVSCLLQILKFRRKGATIIILHFTCILYRFRCGKKIVTDNSYIIFWAGRPKNSIRSEQINEREKACSLYRDPSGCIRLFTKQDLIFWLPKPNRWQRLFTLFYW